MEAIAESISLLAKAISSIAGWGGMALIIGIGASTFLIYTERITLDDLKNFFRKEKKW